MQLKDRAEAVKNFHSQVSLRNCFTFHGKKEEKSENNDTVTINRIKEEMDIEFFPNDLDRLHRLRNSKTKHKERTL